MKKLCKLFGSLALGCVVLFGAKSASASTQADVSFTGNQSAVSTPTFIAAPMDRNNLLPPKGNEDLGWKIFETSGTASLVQVTDSQSKAPACALVHKICVDSAASGYAIAYDSGSANGLTLGSSAGALGGKCTASSTAQVCCIIDTKVNQGIIFGESLASSEAYLFWAPCDRKGK